MKLQTLRLFHQNKNKTVFRKKSSEWKSRKKLNWTWKWTPPVILLLTFKPLQVKGQVLGTNWKNDVKLLGHFYLKHQIQNKFHREPKLKLKPSVVMESKSVTKLLLEVLNSQKCWNHSLEIAGFFCHSDFTWNFWDPRSSKTVVFQFLAIWILLIW